MTSMSWVRAQEIMRKGLLLVAGLIVISSIFGCGSDSEPEAVYRQYLAKFKAMRSLDDRSIESYLSTMARQKMAEYRLHPPQQNCNPCGSPEAQLRMIKTM